MPFRFGLLTIACAAPLAITIMATGATDASAAPVALVDTLQASTSTVSIATGGTQQLEIDMGTGFAGEHYICIGSLSGTAGIQVGSYSLPLTQDLYFAFTLANLNAPPLLNSLGTLDSAGQATVTFQIGPAPASFTVGLTAHHAATVISATDQTTVVGVTNAVPLTFVL